ncbi:hypothetical protein [Streptomyces sp. NPDC015130]|uniref:hypothetical protein n=1 Tax=Streptomyces sp. NPDC015130 TaxID=3364940 RepID=UPI0036FB655C
MMDRRTRTLGSATHPSDVVNKVTTPDFHSEALRRARATNLTVVRPARRTLAEMAPGFVRQPVLRLVPATPAASNERCLFCDSWLCDGVSCQQFAPVPAGTALKVAA